MASFSVTRFSYSISRNSRIPNLSLDETNKAFTIYSNCIITIITGVLENNWPLTKNTSPSTKIPLTNKRLNTDHRFTDLSPTRNKHPPPTHQLNFDLPLTLVQRLSAIDLPTRLSSTMPSEISWAVFIFSFNMKLGGE